MSYFNRDFIKFFKGLRANNKREWFQENKKMYEREVKEPFYAFVEEMILRVQGLEPNIHIEPRDAIFRIYRDVRFSKDKIPYKEHVSAAIAEGGRKAMDQPGIYFQMNDQEIKVYGGLYKLDKTQLLNVRTAIAADLDGFQELLDDFDFQAKYNGILHGEQHKRIPKEFIEVAEKQPLIKNKQFYYFGEIDMHYLTSNQLPEQMMDMYMAGIGMKEFLADAVS